MAANQGAKTVYVEVRCDIHGTESVNSSNRAKVLRVNPGGTGFKGGCPVSGCPNNPHTPTADRYKK